MRSLYMDIHDNVDIVYTLSWLLQLAPNVNAKKVVNRAVAHKLISIETGNHWKANKSTIIRLMRNPKVVYPPLGDLDAWCSIILGIGEMSARSHGNFKAEIVRKFNNIFYKRALIKILSVAVKRLSDEEFSVERIAHSQFVSRVKFNSQFYQDVCREIDYGSRLHNANYGLSFLVSLCFRLQPVELSAFIERNKRKAYVSDLCVPMMEAFMFRDVGRFENLLKGKSTYLKLQACASIVQQETFNSDPSIKNNIQLLSDNGIAIEDTIWLVSLTLRNRYTSEKNTRNRLEELNKEIYLLEKYPERCPRGAKPESWIESKKRQKDECENQLPEAEINLKNAFQEIANAWPEEGISHEQVKYLIHLSLDVELCRKLVDLIPSSANKQQILEHILSDFGRWVGFARKEYLELCEDTFSYSSERELDAVINAARSLIMLSHEKGGANIGKTLGNRVSKFDNEIASFISRPFMNVRKVSIWHSACSRLGVVHLLAMCVFDETPEEYESEISPIVGSVVDKVHLLFKIFSFPSHLGADELFSDLSKVTSRVISKKNYLSKSALSVADDDDLPPDYRIRVIATNPELIHSHKDIVAQLFEEFGKSPLYTQSITRRFTEWINLLDLCLGYCWKYRNVELAGRIVEIWEKSFSDYIEETPTEYLGYANKINLALASDGEERDWLIQEEGFKNSHSMLFLNGKL